MEGAVGEGATAPSGKRPRGQEVGLSSKRSTDIPSATAQDLYERETGALKLTASRARQNWRQSAESRQNMMTNMNIPELPDASLHHVYDVRPVRLTFAILRDVTCGRVRALEGWMLSSLNMW